MPPPRRCCADWLPADRKIGSGFDRDQRFPPAGALIWLLTVSVSLSGQEKTTMKVSDIMTPRVESASTEATVGQAIRLMMQKHISGLAVVDAKGVLTGNVPEVDFLRGQEIGRA